MCIFFAPAGTYGNLGRNTVNGPGTNKTRFAVVKNTALTERMKLQFRAEFFNLFNHPQFNVPNLSVFSSSGAYSGTAGRITLTDGTVPGLGGRNIQFGLKLTFRYGATLSALALGSAALACGAAAPICKRWIHA